MLSLQSTKKYKANITRQFHKMRSTKRPHIVCVTDKNAASLAECVCSYHAVIKRKRTKDESKYYIEKEGRNLKHNGQIAYSKAITMLRGRAKLETETSCQSSIRMPSSKSLSRTRTVTPESRVIM